MTRDCEECEATGVCNACQGDGFFEVDSEEEDCEECDGTGTCSTCDGSGEVE
jgi:hypothetical protein